jgi:hypothetical protein
MLRILAAAFVPLVMSACAATPLPDVLPQLAPDDSTAGIRNTAYARPTAGYIHRMPEPPKTWRQMNDAQAPSAGGGS